MKRHTLSLLGLAIMAVPGFAQQSVRTIVTFHGDPDEGVITRAGGSVVLKSSHLVAANLPPGKAAAVAADPAVASVELDAVASAAVVKGGAEGKTGSTSTPAPQPAQSTPWGIDRVDADLTWATTTGAGVKVAVVDTGIYAAHADFKNASGASRVILGPSYVSGAKTSNDDNGHGTHCAGTIGASQNAIGVVGIAPSCTLVAVKVLDRNGSGWISAIISGIDWASLNGAKVISLSLGSSSDVQSLHDAVDRAVARGVVVCAAAGNEGDQVPQPISYPGAYDSAIGVAATGSDDKVTSWSSKGAYVDVAAPGLYVNSTWKDGYYKTISGTSMATPHVAGSAALLVASGVTAVADVRARIEGTADDINAATLPGKDSEIGNGLLDTQEAVTGVQTLP